jgi:hypothetical protein
MTARIGISLATGLLLGAGPVFSAGIDGHSASGGAAAVATTSGPGWLAWYGCWTPVDDDAPEATLVCVLPGADDAAARITTWVDGSMTGEVVVRADGVSRPVEEGGCVGQQTARWSNDGRRVFVRSDFQCGGIGRTSTGVLALVAENEWVDVQAVTIADQHLARSIRYRAVRSDDVPAEVAAVAGMPGAERRMALETARLQMSLPLAIDAVIEATREIAPPAVEALLGARQHGFNMDAGLVMRLEREQVPASVIDMMVALSYPQRFAVQARPRVVQDDDRLDRGDRGLARETCYDPFFMRPAYGAACAAMPRYGRYDTYGYGSRYGYSPWGYDPYGWHPGRSPVVVIVDPTPGRERGEVVKGRGYVNPTGTTGDRGSARPRQDPAGSGGGGVPRAATPSSGTSRAAPSSGSTPRATEERSGGSNTGRTAVPRGGGNQGGNQDGAQDDIR